MGIKSGDGLSARPDTGPLRTFTLTISAMCKRLQKTRKRLHVVLFLTAKPLRGLKSLVNVCVLFPALHVHALFYRLWSSAS
jgi:hypothetical protein